MNKGLFTSNSDEWETPQDFFDRLNDEFHFTLDPCSTDKNAKCAKHYTKEQDGLSQDWKGETVFCNPPYGREQVKWIRKCYEHFIGGVQRFFSFRRGQIQKCFMSTYTVKQKSDSSKADFILTEVNGTLHFRQWWLFIKGVINDGRGMGRCAWI